MSAAVAIEWPAFPTWHAATVTREMGIPAVGGLGGLGREPKDGGLVEVDGTTDRVARVE